MDLPKEDENTDGWLSRPLHLATIGASYHHVSLPAVSDSFFHDSFHWTDTGQSDELKLLSLIQRSPLTFLYNLVMSGYFSDVLFISLEVIVICVKFC